MKTSSIFSHPGSWGPPAWTFLHCVSMTYPEKPDTIEQKKYKQFFSSLGNVLPCKKCRVEYKIWLKKYPIENHLSSRKALVRWLVRLHNDVNRRNNKPVRKIKDAILDVETRCSHYLSQKP